MTDAIIPEHRPAALGAPFEVVLLSSVRKDGDSMLIPDMGGMITGVGMARLWRDQRLGGTELHYLRKSAGITKDKLGEAMGGSANDIESYETGPRPMTVGIEKYIRLHLFNALRRMDPTSPRVDQMINYLEWVLEEWKPAFRDAATPIEIALRHTPTGWQELRTKR